MQSNRLLSSAFIFLIALFPFIVSAQVNTVDYGKNRIQYKKFQWKFYQTRNFNTYSSQGGLELGKFVAQAAEEELKSIEQATEYSLQRKANIIVYNTYDDYKQSNIGLGIDWQNAGGLTKLVNNKMVLYFNGDHENLKMQIRQGIARVLTDNILFGDDIGEVASNAALLDLPKWLTDGYVAYIAQNWSTSFDDQLKSAMLSGTYSNFYQFAFKQPDVAGHAFWYYIQEKYKKENVTYFLYLARLYKNLNTASLRICKKKFKNVLDDFMQYESEKYLADLKGRRNAPKGKLSVVEETTKSDFFRFNGNPNPRNNSYAVVEFTKGVYKVKYVDNNYDEHVLLKYGVKTYQGDINPNYPILAWDGKGSRLLVIYWKEGKINMFVYDVIANFKRFKQQIDGFDQVLDAGFMLDAGTLLLSAVKNGHSDIFTYKIETGRIKQITNDVFDDLNPTVVAFPNRVGIIFSSNRPGPNAVNSDTALPSRNHFNIFLIDINNNSEIKQISQLTNVKFGDAKYPMQYNVNHFTYVNDENGIANRWAGFFTTQRAGLDTLWYVGDQILRNPGGKELDSTLSAWQKAKPDSVSYFQVYKDSTYTFPITNYQSSLLETRIAGNNGQVSEVRREGDYKFLYKLKPDSLALRRRNVNPRPTEYIKQLLIRERLTKGASTVSHPTDSAQSNNKGNNNLFQNEFENDKKDTASNNATGNSAVVVPRKTGVLANAGLFNYGLKFSTDYVLAGFTNNVIINRYQPYAGGAGPIRLDNGQDLSWMFRVGVSDVMEDIKLIGGFRFGTTLSDKDAFLSFQNYRKRIDWGLTYYRSNVNNYQGFYQPGNVDTSGLDKSYLSNNLVTNLYQANASFPIDEVRSVRLTAGVRTDKGIIKPFPYPDALKLQDSTAKTLITRLEYVYDNTIAPAQNIWNGLRWKVYTDFWAPMGKTSLKGKHILNVGADARYYVPIYRNFIWAGRVAADFSMGDAKVIYYLGGVDGSVLSPKFNNNPPNPSVPYAFQTLAVNMRGYNQNLANGNNDLIINSEFRLPVFTTFFNKPINNAFIRNFQLIQFIDLGTAWDGTVKNIARPSENYSDPSTTPVSIKIRAGGIGPLAGGYGFGARTTLLGYFIKYDIGWPMKGVFRGAPASYLALGLDF
ncbi:MAG: hypothetical protein M3R72_05910 [Bacteroidota bacterium]|nr:hypothetical protein [Bacteroidota bacterium]